MLLREATDRELVEELVRRIKVKCPDATVEADGVSVGIDDYEFAISFSFNKEGGFSPNGVMDFIWARGEKYS